MEDVLSPAHIQNLGDIGASWQSASGIGFQSFLVTGEQSFWVATAETAPSGSPMSTAGAFLADAEHPLRVAKRPQDRVYLATITGSRSVAVMYFDPVTVSGVRDAAGSPAGGNSGRTTINVAWDPPDGFANFYTVERRWGSNAFSSVNVSGAGNTTSAVLSQLARNTDIEIRITPSYGGVQGSPTTITVRTRN